MVSFVNRKKKPWKCISFLKPEIHNDKRKTDCGMPPPKYVMDRAMQVTLIEKKNKKKPTTPDSSV